MAFTPSNTMTRNRRFIRSTAMTITATGAAHAAPDASAVLACSAAANASEMLSRAYALAAVSDAFATDSDTTSSPLHLLSPLPSSRFLFTSPSSSSLINDIVSCKLSIATCSEDWAVSRLGGARDDSSILPFIPSLQRDNDRPCSNIPSLLSHRKASPRREIHRRRRGSELKNKHTWPGW